MQSKQYTHQYFYIQSRKNIQHTVLKMIKYHCKCSSDIDIVVFSQVWWVFLLLHQFSQEVERCSHLGPLALHSSRPQVEKFQVARGVAHPWRGTRNIRVATQNPSHPLKCLRKEEGSLALRSVNIRVFVCQFKNEYVFVGHKDKVQKCLPIA